ncbi:hypothetical protein M0D69_28650 [Caballeronia sp. SEWSISQ10-4 2]|uniref:hypothetical protein n=1 Tax=Caballeronia sp. SEWSISQ10-4 2 TaxID=2937438 RepID=UPI0026503837|nr:hypothetical protein [Caballeronia sp. SEWSISQ10-4 2]MDN7181909.1 hypothetical protein [Caballeronia sp. SEWSISQ10-4 2]
MNNSPFYACTAEDPYGYGPSPGLLGPGQSPDPSLSLFRRDIGVIRVPLGGSYATDNLTAAQYIVQRLKSNPDLSASERIQLVLWLREALNAMRSASSRASQSEVGKVYQQARSIPGVGEVIDVSVAPGSLPATLAAGSATLHAVASRAPVSGMLDLPPDLQKRLLQWANKGGNQGIKSARKNFGDVLKITKVDGKFVFEIPASETAKSFVIRGQAAERVIRIPAYRQLAQDALESKTWMNMEGYGSTRLGGILTGAKGTAALSFGPQMVLDAIDSHSFGQWLSLEAHNQPANLAAWGVSFVVAAVLGSASAVVVVPLALGAGVVVALFVNHEGVGNWIGDHVDAWRGYRP